MWGHRRRRSSSDTAAALTHRPPPPHRIVSLLSARPTRRHRCRRLVVVIVAVVVRVSVCPFARASVCECQQLAATVNRAQQSHTASVRGPPSVVFGRTSLQRVVVTVAYAAAAAARFSVVTRYFSFMRFFSPPTQRKQ